ncbi:MAG: PIN domain-containing protein [Gemmatimonadales bacterium]
MSAVFLDASLWLEAMSPKAARHATAYRLLAGAAATRSVIVTTPFVIAEVHSMVARRLGPAAGRRLLDEAWSPAYDVVQPDAAMIAEAIARWVNGYADQPFSLCDAVSFEVMRVKRIAQALTFDHHFATAGFAIVR